MVKVYCISPYTEDLAERLRDQIVVVYDTFRASTTIIYALKRGFKKIIPVRGIEEGLKIARRYGALTAGEKRGRKIREYHFSNSPYQVLRARKATEYLVIRSTNGTRAITGLMKKNIVLIGSTVNASYVADYAYKLAEETKRNIVLLAVGRKGPIKPIDTFEDKLGVAITAASLKKKGAEIDESCSWCLKYNRYKQLVEKLAYNKKIIKLVKMLPSSYFKDLLLTGLINSLDIIGELTIVNNTPLIQSSKI